MKPLFMLFLLVHSLQAVEIPDMYKMYQTPLYMMYGGILFLFLFLLAMLLFLVKKNKKNRLLLEEKEEKIKWLRKIHAENEHRYTQREQEMEKEILKQTHTIESLELKLKEGTRNQVVSKIEELQNRRQAVDSKPSLHS